MLNNLSKVLATQLPMVATAFSLAVVPAIYTETFLWARMGEFRLTTIYLFVFILLLITSSNHRFSALILGLLVYQVFAKLAYFGSTNSLTALNLSTTITLLTMFVAGTALRKKDHVTRFGLFLLSATLFILGTAIIVNSITGLDDIQFIRGLGHRRDVDNFNYIYVAEGFVTGTLILFCCSEIKTGSLIFLIWSLFCIATLWCAGSRASLLLFLVLIVTLYIIELLNDNLSINKFFIFVSSLFLCIISLVAVSQPSVTIRFNPMQVFSDTSFLKRLELVKSLASDERDDLLDAKQICQTQYRSEYSCYPALNPTVNKLKQESLTDKLKQGSLTDRVLSTLFGQYSLGLNSQQLYQHNLLSIYNYYGVPYFIAFLILTAVLATKIKTKDRVYYLFLYLCGNLIFRDDVNPIWWFVVGYIGVGSSLPYVRPRALTKNI